jgi:transglutaminase-like putative cysteine protease
VRVIWCEISTLAVVLTGDVSVWLSVLMLGLIALFGLAPPGSRWLKPVRAVSSVMAIFYLLFFPLDWLVLSDFLIFAVVHLIFYLKLHSLLHLDSERERYRLYVICLFEMLAASSMTVDAVFLVPLVLFVLVGSLMLVLEQSSDRSFVNTPTRPFPMRRAVRAALGLSCLVLLVGGFLFVGLPRTTYGGFRVAGLSGITRTGFGRFVRLGDFGEIKLSREVVMTLVPAEGFYVSPIRWRGAAFDEYDGGEWKHELLDLSLLPKNGVNNYLLDRPSSDARASVEVFLEPLDTDVLFIPPSALEVNVSLPSLFVDPLLTVRSGRVARAGRRYTVGFRPNAPASSSSLGGVERMRDWRRRRYTKLPPLSTEFHALARRFEQSNRPRLETAAAVEQYLRNELDYSLVTPSRVREDPVEDFLFESRAGHCEYFATAMVLLLRAQSIPSRLVTGFGRGRWVELTDFEVVRKSDAHAWVEVFDEQTGWNTFDPTPPATDVLESGTFGFLSQGIDSLRLIWDMYVVAFDYERQRNVWGGVGAGYRILAATGRRTLSFLERRAALWGGLGTLLVLILVLGRTRWGRKWWLELRIPWPFRWAVLAERPEAAVRFYEDLLRHLEGLGFSKPAGSTPAEFARSLEQQLPGMNELTTLYYRVRFGGQSLDPAQQVRAERLSTAIQVTALSMADVLRRTSNARG